MADFSLAINLIRKYEGYNEKAYPHPNTGEEPYTIGYGTQFYPDGAPVKAGQKCTKEKALEYLFNEVHVIDEQLSKLNLPLDRCMRQSLLSFIHSIGWEPFLYSQIIDCIEQENVTGVCEEMGRWIFDEDYKAIGGLLDRRREEVSLFLNEMYTDRKGVTEILLKAFQNFSGKPSELRAIKRLEESISPYILTEFSNEFRIDNEIWNDYSNYEFSLVFDRLT